MIKAVKYGLGTLALLALLAILYIPGLTLMVMKCTDSRIEEIEASFEKEMSVEESRKALANWSADIYEQDSTKCDADGSSSFPSYQSEGGPCLTGRIKTSVFICGEVKIIAALYFDNSQRLVRWKMSDANPYL